MNEALLKFIISRVIENANDSLEQTKQHPSDDFYKGRKMAYYEILDTIQGELDAHNLNLEEYGLDIDLEKTFL